MKELTPNTAGEWTHDWNTKGLPWIGNANIHDADGNVHEAVVRCNIDTGRIIYCPTISYDPPTVARQEAEVWAKPPLLITSADPDNVRTPSQPSIATSVSK